MPEEQVTEFKAGTVNDLLVAAKGGTTPAADDAKRWKSLAMGGGVSSAVLALALVAVLITGTGSKSNGSKAASTTASTQPLLALPPDTGASAVQIPPAQAASVHQGSYLNITGYLHSDPTVKVEILNALVLAVTTETKAVKDAAPIVTTTAQVAIPNSQQSDLGGIEGRSLRIFVTSGPTTTTATTAPPATQPPATQPATTPPSS
jgi:hypothetical protein